MITRPLTRSRTGQPELLRVKRTNVGEESRRAFGFSSIVAYFDTNCASNRPAEAISGVAKPPPAKSPAASATSITCDGGVASWNLATPVGVLKYCSGPCLQPRHPALLNNGWPCQPENQIHCPATPAPATRPTYSSSGASAGCDEGSPTASAPTELATARAVE